CASLTPAPRFQGSSSLCPSPFNCITRNIKTPSILYFFLSLSFTLLSFLHSCFLYSFLYYFLLPLFFPSFTLLSFLLSFFHSSFFSFSFLNFCISCTGISFRKCIF